MTGHFEVSDRGASVVGIVPLTAKAREWVKENVYAEPWQWLGDTLCVDHRYADDLLTGIEEAFGAEAFQVWA